VAAQTKTLEQYVFEKKDPKTIITDRFKLARDGNAKRRQQWSNIYRAYHGYIKDSQRRQRRSNFHIHKIFPQIELEAARFITGYFSHKPFVAVVNSQGQDPETAKIREETQQYYYEHCPGFYLSTLRLIKYTLLYGCGFRVPSWRTIKQKVKRPIRAQLWGQELNIPGFEEEVEETVYDGLWFETYSPTEVFPHPFTVDFNRLPWCIIQEWIHCEELLSLAEQGAFDVSEVNKIPLNSYSQNDIEYQARVNELGYEKPMEDESMVCLQHQFTPDSFMTLANGETIIRDIDNELLHKKIPIIQGVKTLDPDSFWPVGSALKILPNQKLVNLFTNMMADYSVLTNYPIWKHRPHIDPNYLISVPNQRIPVENPEDVDVVRFPEMKHDLIALKAMIETNIEEITGYFGPQKGFSDTRHTATSDTIFASQGDKRIQYDIMTFENLTLLPEAKMVGALIEQFMPPQVEIYVSGGPAGYGRTVSPEMIRGEFTYRVRGISESINRSLQRAQLVELYNIGANSQQFVRMANGMIAPVPLQDNYYALKELYEAFDRRDAEKIVIRPEVFGQPLNSESLNPFALPGVPGQDQLFTNSTTGALRNSPWPTVGQPGQNEEKMGMGNQFNKRAIL
jgi:hypothetical protein